jgi:hypothetical protein
VPRRDSTVISVGADTRRDHDPFWGHDDWRPLHYDGRGTNHNDVWPHNGGHRDKDPRRSNKILVLDDQALRVRSTYAGRQKKCGEKARPHAVLPLLLDSLGLYAEIARRFEAHQIKISATAIAALRQSSFANGTCVACCSAGGLVRQRRARPLGFKTDVPK